MAKLYFRYGAMNSGKTTALIQVAHNYKERGMETLLLKPGVDVKGKTTLVSRLNVSKDVDLLVQDSDDLLTILKERQAQQKRLACVLVDEA